ncbi:nucleotidyltransferase domain-containing protein [Herbaspirillum sp. RTI4]|uniref:nucleotidyltransferase domain-containing protein n=1 Tax=Herbaspirillum sp. RTI4 TaxID=3048640 RepID=UPI002AB416DD|nr:nucleotidyltransferase domain-containing protein [Herbaspirillum sp. RTI4]MDY7580084.1 nucleotidyltransferase domain-containing protein [Herbaspirillum sp. RTI4]MEA9983135.1 nucleotidyltransferase domain-containing protein [Herbaspirillum sp. RTI4]
MTSLTIPLLGIIIPIMGIYADALFTKTQQRVLAVLYGQSQRSFYANEIIGLASIGSGAVQRELARLEASALVTVRRVGNQKHYQANHEAPIFEELRSIVLKTFGVADVLRAALHSLWPLVDIAFVYGSLAKGTEHASSDVDLMVIGAVTSNAELLEALLPAQAQLGRVVNPTLYTPDEFAQRVRDGRSFIVRVLEQPKIFVKGSEHDITRLGSAG